MNLQMKRITPFTIILFCLCFVSCGALDPNKHIDEGDVRDQIYESQEIGWTMAIPNGWSVTRKSVSDERTKEGLNAFKESAGIDYDASGLKQLLNFHKDRAHVFQSSSEPFPLLYEGEWEENGERLKHLIYETYTSQGVRVDTSSSKKKIDNLDFEVFHIKIYSPEGETLLYQDMYSRYINGFDFGVNLSYINEKEKNEMLTAWENSKFK